MSSLSAIPVVPAPVRTMPASAPSRLPRSTVSGTIVATSSSIREPGGACAGSASTGPLSLAICTARFLWCTRISASKRSRSAGSLAANVTRLLVPVRGRKSESLRRTEMDGATNVTVSSSMSATAPSSSSNGRPPTAAIAPSWFGPMATEISWTAPARNAIWSGCSSSSASATQTRIQGGPGLGASVRSAGSGSAPPPPFASAASAMTGGGADMSMSLISSAGARARAPSARPPPASAAGRRSRPSLRRRR